jgi:hypothetical protein
MSPFASAPGSRSPCDAANALLLKIFLDLRSRSPTRALRPNGAASYIYNMPAWHPPSSCAGVAIPPGGLLRDGRGRGAIDSPQSGGHTVSLSLPWTRQGAVLHHLDRCH